MKDKLTAALSMFLVLLIVIGSGLIAIYLGMKLPYELFKQGEWGYAIAQLVIIWSWLLGGNRK